MGKEFDIAENDDIRLFDDLAAITRSGAQLGLIQRRVEQFVLHFGRRPRVIVSHTEPGARKQSLNRIGTILAQWGFDVDIGPMDKTPAQIALMALENDVHMVVLLYSKNPFQRTSTELRDALRGLAAEDILVAVFGPAPAHPNNDDSRTGWAGTSDLMVFNPKSANDVIAMLDNFTRKN
jgi:methylmalonyl-CoA mutase